MPAAIDKTILIDAALSVWREEGYRTATTLKVAQRADVGEVTLFRRFGSKSALFQAALESEASRFQATGVTYSGDLTADLSAMVDAYQSLLALNGAIVLDVLVESPKNAELAAIAKTPMHAIQAASRVLMRYQDRGALRPGDPLVLVSALLGPLVMRYAVARTQPGVEILAPTPQVVGAFLNGWYTGPFPRPEV